MSLLKVIGADERKIKQEIENDFQHWLIKDLESALEFADESQRNKLLSVTDIRKIVSDTILLAHWPTTEYKLKTIAIFSKEPYNMSNYLPLITSSEKTHRFRGI